MASKDLSRRISPIQSLPSLIRVDGTANGASADLAGYESAAIILNVGIVTDGTHTLSIQDSDDNTTFGAVAAGDLAGAPGVLVTATQQEIGYRGRKRYVRPVVVTTGATLGASAAAVIVRGDAHAEPAV